LVYPCCYLHHWSSNVLEKAWGKAALEEIQVFMTWGVKAFLILGGLVFLLNLVYAPVQLAQIQKESYEQAWKNSHTDSHTETFHSGFQLTVGSYPILFLTLNLCPVCTCIKHRTVW